ncbi:MAG TPA: hypothetical protein VGB27_17230 [Candidatus Binatia bacterium]
MVTIYALGAPGGKRRVFGIGRWPDREPCSALGRYDLVEVRKTQGEKQ